MGASDVAAGGASGGEGTVHLWHRLGFGAALTAGGWRFDTPPLEEPDARSTWTIAARISARLR